MKYCFSGQDVKDDEPAENKSESSQDGLKDKHEENPKSGSAKSRKNSAKSRSESATSKESREETVNSRPHSRSHSGNFQASGELERQSSALSQKSTDIEKNNEENTPSRPNSVKSRNKSARSQHSNSRSSNPESNEQDRTKSPQEELQNEPTHEEIDSDEEEAGNHGDEDEPAPETSRSVHEEYIRQIIDGENELIRDVSTWQEEYGLDLDDMKDDVDDLLEGQVNVEHEELSEEDQKKLSDDQNLMNSMDFDELITMIQSSSSQATR